MFLIVLSGCKTYYCNDECLSGCNNSILTFKEYTGDSYYCFNSEYYGKDVCLPYTEDVKRDVLEYDNITNYWIVNISK